MGKGGGRREVGRRRGDRAKREERERMRLPVPVGFLFFLFYSVWAPPIGLCCPHSGRVFLLWLISLEHSYRLTQKCAFLIS
jgi:hypothetical protein